MRVGAVILARGGSKGVPGKNVARVGGIPLIARAVRSACAARGVDEVLVSTDGADIAAAARAAGAEVIDRPAELAVDTASSESALLHALGVRRAAGRPLDVVVFIQPTSPFIFAADIDAAVERVVSGEADVAFAAFETYAFLWADAAAGAVGVNHDHSFRPRRQDREPHYQETGAFYVMRAVGFEQAGFRFFGRVAVQPVSEDWAIEIDTPAELERARLLAPGFDDPAQRERPERVAAVITDFDGVHTDDTALTLQDGIEGVTVSRSDGMGVELLRRAGIPFLILSKESNPVVAARAAKLGVEVLQAVEDKATAISAWMSEKGVDPADVVYVGNDVNDLPALGLVGWPMAVADARPEAVAAARIVLSRSGGRGAIRELADVLLARRG
ncbi:MAG: acylneuraminate cytidylyltransferase [Microbacterium sp.]